MPQEGLPCAATSRLCITSHPLPRTLSGFTRPSKANEAAFNLAVEQVTQAAQDLLGSLVTNAPPRDREVEASKARARSAERYGTA